MPFVAAPLDERLDAQIDRSAGPSRCWPWTGGTRGGAGKVTYGRIKASGRSHPAHRLILERKLGRPLGDGKMALHTCDFGLCCNPDHLYEGDHGQNMRDRNERGRTKGAPGGELHHAAKLTDAQAGEIRRRRGCGAGLKELADEFGVSFQRISQIAR